MSCYVQLSFFICQFWTVYSFVVNFLLFRKFLSSTFSRLDARLNLLKSSLIRIWDFFNSERSIEIRQGVYIAFNVVAKMCYKVNKSWKYSKITFFNHLWINSDAIDVVLKRWRHWLDASFLISFDNLIQTRAILHADYQDYSCCKSKLGRECQAPWIFLNFQKAW